MKKTYCASSAEANMHLTRSLIANGLLIAVGYAATYMGVEKEVDFFKVLGMGTMAGFGLNLGYHLLKNFQGRTRPVTIDFENKTITKHRKYLEDKVESYDHFNSMKKDNDTNSFQLVYSTQNTFGNMEKHKVTLPFQETERAREDVSTYGQFLHTMK